MECRRKAGERSVRMEGRQEGPERWIGQDRRQKGPCLGWRDFEGAAKRQRPVQVQVNR